MQINRLFEMIYILLERQTMTAKELAQRFEVSSRTIYRDVEVLSQAGIPIYMQKGKGGGIFLLPNYTLNKAMLTEDEKAEILAAIHAVKTVDIGQGQTVVNKLSSFWGNNHTDWIEVDFGPWADIHQERQAFELLKEAIIQRHLVQFDYANGKGENSHRSVEPLKLCFKGQGWYLYGYCHLKTDFRFFKLRRITALSVSTDFFQRDTPSKILLQEHGFEDEMVTIEMKLSPQMAFRVYAEFQHYQRLADGSFLVVFTMPKGQWIFSHVMSFGEHGEIISPREIRAEIAQQIEKILKHYQ